ncbi:transposase [Thiohalorhabdus denitrificans]|nr:transposase [Thiohalorhabdus denitrificans]KPV39150.1 transposase [Thiohalorhabdus denitrificans]
MPEKGYHRLRRGRYSEPGRAYLLTTVTAGREALFESLPLARSLVACLRVPHNRGEVRSLAFVVMPDHLHWLVQLERPLSLTALMRSVKTYSAQRINTFRGTKGVPVWQRGFHDRAVRKEEDLRALARYVIANPLRAGLVERIEDYPHWDAAWLDGKGRVI